MSGAISFWSTVIILSSIVVVIGCLLSDVLRNPLVFGVAATLSVAGACCASFLLGAVGILWALERSEVTHIPDGKNDVSVTLKLGAFTYSRTIPVVKQQSEDVRDGK